MHDAIPNSPNNPNNPYNNSHNSPYNNPYNNPSTYIPSMASVSIFKVSPKYFTK